MLSTRPKHRTGQRSILAHFRLGIHYGIPLCCNLHFCWDNLFGRAARMTRWKQTRQSRSVPNWVPCGLRHAHGSPFRPARRLVRILTFEAVALLPTGAGRRLRSVARLGSAGYRHADIDKKKTAIRKGEIENLWWQDCPDL